MDRALRILTDPSVGQPDAYRERDHVHGVLRAAAASPAWPSSIQTAVILSAHRRHRSWPSLTGLKKPLIVALGDEDARLSDVLLRRCVAVLQCYRPDLPSWPPQVLRLPLGPGGEPPATASRNWRDRDLDVVFVGHLHARRWPLARGLGLVDGPLKALPDTLMPAFRRRLLTQAEVRPLPHRDTVLRFTERFGQGLPAHQHLDLLSRARIALVPPGFKQDETFRHHEAARAGCVLVGAPSTDYPVIPVPSPDQLCTLLETLLSDKARLHAQHLAVSRAWRERGDPHAVGLYIAEQLSEVLGHPKETTR